MKKYLFSIICSLAVFSIALNPAQAQYPEKTITLISPYAAGGSSDIMARSLASALGKELKTTVIVKNVTGAGGMIGTAELAKAKADGYTLGFMPIGPVTLQQYQRKLPYTNESFDYIGLAVDFPMLVMSNKNLPWTDFNGMREEVLKNPKKYIYGSPGVGSMPHIIQAYTFKAIASDVRHMPSTDGATIFAAMAGNTMHFFANMAADAIMQDLLPLAVAGPERLPELPDVPTFKELNVNVPDIVAWWCVMAPKGLPAEISAVLDQAVANAVASEEFAELGKKLYFTPSHLAGKELDNYIAASTKNINTVMVDLGFSKQ